MSTGFDSKLASIPRGDILGGDTTTILHPLAVMNMSNHATTVRVSAGPNQRRQYAVGLLMGSRSVQGVEIMTSLELFTSTNEELSQNPTIILDEKKGIARRKRFEQVFPDFDVLGWYALCDTTPSQDLFNIINDQVRRLFDLTKMAAAVVTANSEENSNNAAEVNSDILVAFLPLDTANKTLRGPIALVSPVMGHNQSTAERIETVAFSIQSEESERIGAELATQVGETGKSSLSLQQDVNRMCTSSNLLRARVDVLKRYLVAVRDKKIEGNPTILQRIGTVCARLPSNAASADSPLAAAMSQQETDALMVVFATVMNTVLNEATTLSESANLALNGECLYGNPFLSDKFQRKPHRGPHF